MSADEAAAAPVAMPQPASVWRRFGAALYDAMLLIGLMMVVTALLLPFTKGEAITGADVGVWEYAYRTLLLVLIVGFYGLFWTLRGQTLGMAAWRLRLERDTGAAITWGDTLKRLAAACVSWAPFALGYFWILIDRDRLAWHDRWTSTRVVVLPKKSNS